MPSTEGFEIIREDVTTWVGTDADGPFHCENIAPLWDGVAVDLVNRPIAGALEQTYPPVPVGTRVAVTVIALGEFDLNSDPSADPRSEVLSHLAYLAADVIAPVETGDGTATLKLYGVGGALEGVAAVQFVGTLRPVPINPDAVAVTFDMYLPKGVPIPGAIS